MGTKAKIISSKPVFKGKWVSVREDKIIKPSGSVAIHEVVERKSCSLIIAVQNHKFYMIEQYRYPANEMSLEFPIGFVENKETPKEAAKRELQEETGLIAQNLEYLGWFWIVPGLVTQKVHIYFTDKFKKGTKSLDETETDLKTKLIATSEIKTLLKKNKIKSSPVLAALSLLMVQKTSIL